MRPLSRMFCLPLTLCQFKGSQTLVSATFVVFVWACTVPLASCDAALPNPDPGRFEAVVDGDLAATLSGRAVLAPVRFAYTTTPPRRFAVHPIELVSDSDSLDGLTVSVSYEYPGDEPPPEIPEGTFEIGAGEASTPAVLAGVSTPRGSVVLSRGRVTIQRVSGGVRGTIEGYGSARTFGGVRVSANVRGAFFATPGPAQP